MILSQFAKVLLGYKSFLNGFFYVDQDSVNRFGIEAEFLRPIYVLADLDSDAYWQTSAPCH
jgi:hypothetical protein